MMGKSIEWRFENETSHRHSNPRSVLQSFTPLRRLGSILWILLISAGLLQAGSSWLSNYSSVILVSGLAGDLESENEYRNLMRSWLDLLASHAYSGPILILSDTGIDNPPAGLNITQHKASRAEFLALAPFVSTNTVLLAAWGHGGLQGDLPVFHVRGPRLSASDFESVGNATTNASDWILIFRGSGAFSRALDRPGRRLLSSEGDTAYSNDPVGMPILLNLLKTEDRDDFANLAQTLGPAVAQWYESRGLVRTEQPTLWTGAGKPKVFDTLAPPIPTRDHAATGNPITNLPPAWKEIHPVDPRQYPGENAVILSRHVNCTLDNRPFLALEQEEFIQILSTEGKRFADFDFQYSPPGQDIRFFDCEILKPDDTLMRLDPEAIRDAASGTEGNPGNIRRKIFSLPQAEPGAILHVHMQTRWEKFPMPHISVQVPLDAEVPLLHETFCAIVSSGDAFHFALQNITSINPKGRQNDYGTFYTWQFENLPPRNRESLSPPGEAPRIFLSTFPDWAAFTDWYTRICKLTDDITPAISTKAIEITRDAQTDVDKIKAVAQYVTGLRYVAVEMGVNSFRPHTAEHVLQNQYGDCKDKANLFNTLVRALKIDGLRADLVLVPRFSQASPEAPGMAFNHAISRVILRGTTNWFDTTDDVCRPGMLPPGDPGRNVLVIDGHSTSLTPLPEPSPKDHRLNILTRISAANGPDGLSTASIEATADGFADYALRLHARDILRHATNTPLLETALRPINGEFILKSQSIAAIAAIHTNFTVQMKGQFIGTALTLSTNRLLLRPPFWLPREWEAVLHQRSTPLFLNQGYPLALDQKIEWDMPGAILTPKEARQSPQGPLSWKLEWQREDTRIIASLHVELAPGGISDFNAAQQQLRALLSAISGGAECLIAADKHTIP
jgi:hypothetical protein